MLHIYYFLAPLLTPLLKLLLKRRLKQGKEDPARLYERFGGASLSRPEGKLVWIHAASVGESVSVLQFIFNLRHQHPGIIILLTTGTVTAARLMSQRLPRDVIHQYVPLDVPRWVNRFLDHWQPNAVIFLESELWPNMLKAIKQRSIPLMLLNANLSEKTYRRWLWVKSLARELFSFFDRIMTPSLETATRLKALGANTVDITINLKFTTNPLPVDLSELARITPYLQRPLFTAVCTHPDEEELVIDAYQKLKRTYPDLLLVLAPRHPNRMEEVARLLSKDTLQFARHSQKEVPAAEHQAWLIDTIGDLGLVYSLAPFCFLGGSLVPIGGHNAIEPLALDCLVIQGHQTFKSNHINAILAPVLTVVHNVDELVMAVKKYLDYPESLQKRRQQAQNILFEQRQGLDEIIDRVVEQIV